MSAGISINARYFKAFDAFPRPAVKDVRELRRTGTLFACVLALTLDLVKAGEMPRRVVSLSLCTDQLALLLADRTQIASLSYLSRDTDLSYMAAVAAGIPVNRGTAEEALVLDPDLILAGPWGSYQTGKLLERLGYRVMFLPPADDFGSIRAQVRLVADALGQTERGTMVLESMERELARHRRSNATAMRWSGLAYLAGGYTQGSGTLLDAVLRESGFSNTAVEAGIAGYAPLDLETVVLLNPDYLIVQPYRTDAPTAAKALLKHPVLLRSGLATRTLTAALPRLACGTPAVVEAVAELAADLVR